MYCILHTIDYNHDFRDHYNVEATMDEAESYIERMAELLPEGGRIDEVVISEVEDRLLRGSIYTLADGTRVRIGIRAVRGTRYCGRILNDLDNPVGAAVWWYCNGRNCRQDRTQDIVFGV